MPDQFAELRHELAVANRILANEGIIDAFGHISARNPKDPNRYFISRHRASELVEPSDILEMTLDSKPVVPTNLRLYSEMVIHGEIYKARPDVNSVCHHHAPSVLRRLAPHALFSAANIRLLRCHHPRKRMIQQPLKSDVAPPCLVILSVTTGCPLARA